MIKIKLGIDIDGTLAQSYGDIFREKQEKRFKKIYSNKETGQFKDSKIENFLINVYFKLKWLNWRNVKLTDNRLPEIIKRLSKNGFEINIISSSFGRKNDIKNWLNKNKITYSNLIFTNPDEKYKYADILIDDRHDIILNTIKHGKIGILYHYHHFGIDKYMSKKEEYNFFFSNSWENIENEIYHFKKEIEENEKI